MKKTNETMKRILRRVLNEELGKQRAWEENETAKGYPTIDRKWLVKEIENFMIENEIEFDNDHMANGYYREKR